MHNSIWLEKELLIVSVESGNVSKLRVQGFGTCASAQQLSSKYMLSFHNDREGKLWVAAWTNEICTGNVMVSFSKFKENSKVLGAVANLINEIDILIL